MKEKSKKCLLANFVIAAVSYAVWIAATLTLLFALSSKENMGEIHVGLNFGETLKIHWEGIISCFTDLGKLGSLGAEMYRPLLAIVLSLIVVASIVVGTVFALRKKRNIFIVYAVALVLVTLPMFDLLGNGQAIYFADLKHLSSNLGTQSYLLAFIIYLFVVLFALITIIFIFVTYGLGLSYVIKYPADYVEPNPVQEIPQIENSVIADAIAANMASESAPVEAEPLPDGIAVMAEEPAVDQEPTPEPAPEPAPEEKPVQEEKKEDPLTQSALAAMLREVVRDIVRDEIARNNANQVAPAASPNPAGNQSITGATFGGPLVVQYFNGGINGVTPPCGAPVPPQPLPEPAKPVEAPKPVEEVKPVETPAPVVEVKAETQTAPAVVVPVVVKTAKESKAAVPVEKKPIERIPFPERLLASDKELISNYNEIKNEILSWGVKSRVSNSGDTFRLHTKTYIKLTVAGKSLKLYFALDPQDYAETKIPVQDASKKNLYAEIPLVFKVKSGLSMRRCKELIQDCMEKDGLEQGEIGTVNWAKELKAELTSSKK